MSSDLSIHEEIMLLDLNDEKGTGSGQLVHYGLAGGILAELILKERIELTKEKKRQWVSLRSAAPLGDAVLDAALAKIAAAKRRADLKTWASRIGGTSKLKHKIAEGLCNKGILKKAEGKVLWVFPRTIYPELDPGPERALVERLEAAIFSSDGNVDARTTILVALAHASGVLSTLYPRKQLKQHKERIERIANGDLVGEAVGATIAAVQTAVMVAVILPAIITPTIHSH